MKSTSLKVFRLFLPKDSNNSIDARGINSIECFQHWCAVHHHPQDDLSAKKFYRALSNHVSGVDGRNPFSPDEESAILHILRIKQRWPCFPHLSIGETGYRSRGFHEKTALIKKRDHCKNSPFSTHCAVSAEVSTEDQKSIFKTLEDVFAYIRSFPDFKFEVWKGVLSIYRMILLSRTPGAFLALENMSSASIQLLGEDLSQRRGPGFVVMVYNLLAEQYVNLIVYQNQMAIDFFGPLVGSFGYMIVDPSDARRSMLGFLYAIYKPGREYFIQRLKVRNHLGESKHYDVTVCCDPMHMLVFLSAKESQEIT